MALLDSAADALAYAHAQGIVHHWVSPSSLFVAWSKEGPALKVLDFGVARVLNEHTAITAVGISEVDQEEGRRVLRPAYAAPEQIDRTFGETGPWTDVYAFARVLYEALAGRPVVPAKARVTDVLEALRTGAQPSAREMGLVLAPPVEAVLMRALALSPSDRYPDMRAFWSELTEAVTRTSRSVAPAPVDLTLISCRA
jgi:serine/threonine protein kinase